MTGAGFFKDSRVFSLNGEDIRGRKFIIATGSRPSVPDVGGLREAGVLTNETALELTRLPSSLVIIGAGPIAVEFAQIFSRLGTEVTLLERRGHILPKEDREVSDALRDILIKEGVRIETCKGMEIKRASVEAGLKRLELKCSDGHRVYEAEEILVAMGRRPGVEGLGLEAAGVEYDRKGIKVDGRLRTTAKNIYAVGDVVGHYLFTHVAEYHAGIALSNALFPIKRKVDYRVVPWVTFTDPELARVGLTEDEAIEKYGAAKVRVYRHEFREVDRAVIEGEPSGLIKLVCDSRGTLLGAHVLGPGGGELLGEYVLAMSSKIPVSGISRSIHVYPTVSQAVKRAADQYYREKLFTGWFPRVARFIIRLGL